MEQFAGAIVGLLALVVTAVITRLVKRHFDRKRAARLQALQPLPSRQVRRAQQRRQGR